MSISATTTCNYILKRVFFTDCWLCFRCYFFKRFSFRFQFAFVGLLCKTKRKCYVENTCLLLRAKVYNYLKIFIETLFDCIFAKRFQTIWFALISSYFRFNKRSYKRASNFKVCQSLIKLKFFSTMAVLNMIQQKSARKVWRTLDEWVPTHIHNDKAFTQGLVQIKRNSIIEIKLSTC